MPTLETENDYYAVLGVDPGADSVTIRKAVIAAQRRCTPRKRPARASPRTTSRASTGLHRVDAFTQRPRFDAQLVELLAQCGDLARRFLRFANAQRGFGRIAP